MNKILLENCKVRLSFRCRPSDVVAAMREAQVTLDALDYMLGSAGLKMGETPIPDASVFLGTAENGRYLSASDVGKSIRILHERTGNLCVNRLISSGLNVAILPVSLDVYNQTGAFAAVVGGLLCAVVCYDVGAKRLNFDMGKIVGAHLLNRNDLIDSQGIEDLGVFSRRLFDCYGRFYGKDMSAWTREDFDRVSDSLCIPIAEIMSTCAFPHSSKVQKKINASLALSPENDAKARPWGFVQWVADKLGPVPLERVADAAGVDENTLWRILSRSLSEETLWHMKGNNQRAPMLQVLD